MRGMAGVCVLVDPVGVAFGRYILVVCESVVQPYGSRGVGGLSLVVYCWQFVGGIGLPMLQCAEPISPGLEFQKGSRNDC